MIHEIAPDHIDNQYHPILPADDSNICIFDGGSVLLYQKDGQISWPKYKEIKDHLFDCTYLFSISDDTYFLANSYSKEIVGTEWFNWRLVRDMVPVRESFAAMTAMHLYNWYSSVQFCGKCGTKTVHDEKERMMRCPKCGNMMFPKISPAIVVAAIDKRTDKLLVTKYNRKGYQHYALVAGFVEIGETMEECVVREVLEETGVHVKNVKYFGSQPWGFVGNLMIGFTAELDGDRSITLDEDELAVARWLSPEELPEVPETSSLTRTMISKFRAGTLEY